MANDPPDSLATFVEDSPDGVVVLDAGGSVIALNRAFAHLVGHTDGAALRGVPFASLVADADKIQATALLVRVAASRRSARFDATLVHTSGRRVPCSFGATHVGRRTIVIAHDMSARIRRDDERSRLAERLARTQRLETAGQLASALAHDLNNLLGVMRVNLDLAMESAGTVVGTSKAGNAEDLRRDLEELNAALESSERLTDRLLGFARHDAEIGVNADVAVVVRGVERLVSRSLPTTVTLTTVIDEGLPPVALSPTRLEQGLVNLLMNARDAVDVDGSITVTVSAIPEIGHDDPWQPAIRLEVSDDGAGMTNDVRMRAFEPLFTTKGSRDGTGLGLSSVLAMAREAGGDVQLASREGSGTSIALLLPAVNAPATVREHRDEPVGGARVLIATPRINTADAIEAMLRTAGYRVMIALDAARSASEIIRGRAAVALIDIALPGESVSRLLRHANDAGIGVVLLSSNDGPDALDGATVLTWPFRTDRLLSAIAEAREAG